MNIFGFNWRRPLHDKKSGRGPDTKRRKGCEVEVNGILFPNRTMAENHFGFFKGALGRFRNKFGPDEEVFYNHDAETFIVKGGLTRKQIEEKRYESRIYS